MVSMHFCAEVTIFLNSFPISVSQIAEAMNNSSSALSAAGNNLDESIALLAAANVTVQNASKSSTAIRTITARLRNSKAELDELGEEVMTTAKYQELLNTLTENNVQIVDEATGQYNSTYKIMQQLAAVWNDLDDGIQATLTTQLAGVRNVDVFNSILQNFAETAEGAMDAMENSAGSLSKAYDKYLNSVEAHINTLKASWAELAATAIDSETVTGVIDAGTDIVEAITEMLGSGAFKTLTDIIELVAKLVSVLIKLVDALGLIQPTINAVAIGATINGVSFALTKLSERMVEFVSSGKLGAEIIGELGMSLNGVASSISSAIVPISLGVAALTALYKVLEYASTRYDRLIKKSEEYKKQAQNTQNEISEVNAELEENGEKLHELYKVLRDGTINDASLAEINNLELVNTRLKEKIGLLKEEKKAQEEAADAAIEAAFREMTQIRSFYDSSGQDKYLDYLMYTSNKKKAPEELERSVETGTGVSSGLISYKEQLEYWVSRYKELTGYQRQGLKLTQEQSEQLETITGEIRQQALSLDDQILSLSSKDSDFAKELTAYADILAPVVHEIIQASEAADIATASTKKYRKSLSDLSDAVSKLKSNYDLIEKATSEMNDDGQISYETLKSLMEATEDYSKYLYTSNGQLKIRVDLLRQEADAAYNADVTSIRKEIASLQREIAEYEKDKSEIEMNNADTSGIQAQIDNLMAMIAADEEQLELFDTIYNTVLESAKTSKEEDAEAAKEEAVEITELSDALSELKKNYDILNTARNEMDESGKLSIGTIESIISAVEDYDKVLEIENDEIRLNEEAFKEYYTEKYRLAKEELEVQNAILKTERYNLSLEANQYSNNAKVAEEYEKKLAELDEQIASNSAKLEIYDAAMQAVYNETEEEASAVSDLASVLSSATKQHDLLSKAQEEMAKNGNLSVETVSSLVSESEDYIQFLETENGLITLNTEALSDYIDAQNEAKILELEEAGFTEAANVLRSVLEQIKKGKVDDSGFADYIDDLNKSFSNLAETYELVEKAQSEMSESGALTRDTVESLLSISEDYVDFLETENGVVKLNTEALKRYAEAQYELKLAKIDEDITNSSTDAERVRLEKLKDVYESLLSDIKTSKYDIESLSEYLNELSGSFTKLTNAYDLVETAQREMNSSFGLSQDTVLSIMSASDEYIQFLKVEDGFIRLNTEALKEYADAQNSAKIAEIYEKIASLSEDVRTLNARGDTEAANAIRQQIQLLENEADVLTALFDSLSGGANAVLKTTSFIDEMTSSLSDLADVQDIVANGFVVAADKVRALAATFPELFANAEAYADGSMKLDEQVATAFLENRQAEMQASVESKIIELEAQLATATAKKEFIDAEIELARHAAESESKIDQQAAQYKIDNADAVAEALINAGINEADAYAIAAQSMYDNTFDLDTAIAKATDDISANYGNAFASAADNSAANALAINSNIDKITQQAHQVATAIAGMAAGKIQGREGVIKPGAAGSKKTVSHMQSIGGYTDSNSGNVRAMMNGVISALKKSNVTLKEAEFVATHFDSQIKSSSLADLILSKTSESNALALLQDQLKGQIAVLKNLSKVDLSQFNGKDKTSSSSAGSGGSPSTSSGSGSGDNPFAEMYKYHQHLLAMEQEEVSDYFAWLDKASKEAYQKGWITLDDLRKYEEEVYKGLKEIISDAEDAMKDLVNFRKKMIEKEYEDQKDNLETQLDLLKDFYDEQKELLQEQREEEQYQKEKAEKQRAVTDIEAELAMLGYDNSAKAQKRRLELQQQLAEAQAEYGEFEKDHAYDLAETALENAYEKQSGEIQAQIDAIDVILNDPNTLFNRALDDIRNDTGSLYAEMVAFAEANGEGESTVKRLWENAFIATNDLQKVTSENVQTIAELLEDLPSDISKLIVGTQLQNSTGHSTTGTSTTASNSASSGSSSSSGGGGSSGNIPVGTAVMASGRAYSTVKGTGNSVDVSGKKMYVAQVWDNAANPYWQGDYTYAIAYSKDGSIVGWVRKDQLSGYASGTRYATAGMHRLDEKGSEALFVSSSGDHYRLLSDGDKVFNAEATDFLYRFANGDKSIFRDIFESLFSKSAMNSLTNRQTYGDIRMGDIIINGNTDKTTVSEIRRAQREGLDNLLQQFGRLQRASR